MFLSGEICPGASAPRRVPERSTLRVVLTGQKSGLDEWFRRRMRQIRWKEWKKPRTRVAKLRKPGIRPDLAYQWGNSSRAYWRIAKSPVLHRAVPTDYWAGQGLIHFRAAWNRFQTTQRTAVCEARTYGGVRGGSGNPTHLLDFSAGSRGRDR